MTKAVALYSGGLDSTLAILTVLRQGIEVKAVTFLTHFGCDISDRSSCSKNPFSASEKFGFEVKLCHLADKFIEIVKNPRFGHGKNMNPCVDCRILMLREAKEFMDMIGAEFIITGEVPGQRPMSQRKDALNIIDREAGLKGYILRPLSAKLLKPTIPEERGIIKRELLYDFSGRSRKPQMALANEFGLTDYPLPAGGCLLTEPNYSYRLRELFEHDSDPSIEDFSMLRLGRHFRLSPDCKIIVGRNETENEALLKLSENSPTPLYPPLLRGELKGGALASGDTEGSKGEKRRLSNNKGIQLSVEGYGSPVTVIRGEADEEIIRTAASICARYSAARKLSAVDVKVFDENGAFMLRVPPADEAIIESFRIMKKDEGRLALRV